MRCVVQRVGHAQVEVGGKITGKIQDGLLVFVGFKTGDTHDTVDWCAKKIVELRVFQDSEEKMNLSVKDIGGEILVVSQFTLYADCKKGTRPSFIDAMEPKNAEKLYQYFIEKVRSYNVNVQEGIYQAMMKVSLLNNGPVTIIVEK